MTAVLVALPAEAQVTIDRYQEELEPRLETFMSRQQIPGLAIAIVKDDRVVYAKGFGWTNLDGRKDRVTPLTVFHMASIVKPFVATAVLQLAATNKLDLDAPVVRYLPYFKLADSRYKTITVRQLAAHTSGMPDVTDYKWDSPQTDEGALERYVRSLQGLHLLFAPGSRFAYSNIAYDVLGDVVAKVSAESFESYVQHSIFDPLGMKNSTLLYSDVDPHIMSAGHVLDSRGNPRVSKVYPYNREHSPSSNLHSNALDMTRWAIANMNHGVLDGKRILPESMYAPMWTVTEDVGEPAVGTHVSGEGISWFVGSYRGNFLVTHSGGDLGFITDLAMLPDRKIAVVWMANCDWIDAGPINGPITYAALDAALGIKPEAITLKRSLSRTLHFTIQQDGLSAALKEYNILKREHPDLYDFSEKQLYELGRRLLGENRPKEAVKILQLEISVYPESTRAHQLLGEAVLAGR